MKRRRSLLIRTDDDHRVMLVRGWRASELCRAAGLKPLYSASGRGFLLDLRRLPDLVAFAEWQNVDVRVESAGEAA